MTDRYRDAHGEVARREFGAVRVGVGRGLRSRVRATTTAAGWPRDFSGAFGREARVLCCSWRRRTGPWPCGFAALCGLGRCATCGGSVLGGGSCFGGSVGLSWVDEACPRGWTLPWRSTNQVTTTTDPPTPPRLTGLAATCSWHFRPCVEPQKAPRQPKNMQVSPAPTLYSPRRETEPARPS